MNPLRVKGKQKVFCIGQNKTGTTSLKSAFEQLGYVVGNQRRAERLLDDYLQGKFEKIIRYCRSAEVFQDVPFSCPELFRHIDAAFPGSKFILTVRDSPETWYNSLVNFHTRLFGRGTIPDAASLLNAKYVEQGWIYRFIVGVYGTSCDNPYDKEKMIAAYDAHNKSVIDYFRGRQDDLLVIDLSDRGSYRNFCDFLSISSPFAEFPWENKTSNIRPKV